MIQTRRARWRRRTARAFPGVQPDVVMITACRDERCLRAEPLPQFKTEHAAIKFQRAFEVGDFEMDMADADGRVNRPGRQILFHGGNLLQIPLKCDVVSGKNTATRSPAAGA
jgi:hypothetical protein